MRNNKSILFIIILIITTPLFAQLKEMQIKGKPNKMTSEIVGKRDANGNFCAAIKVVSNMEGLKYDSYNGVVGVYRNPGEDIVYLSSNERVLLIYNTGYNPKKLILTDQGIVLKPKSMWKITIIGEEELKSVSSKNVGKLNVTIKPDEANAYFEIEGLPIKGESGFNEEIAAGTWKLNIKPRSKYYKSTSETVQIKKDQKTKVSTELLDISGYLKINPNVEPVKVYVDGRYDKILSNQYKKRIKHGNYKIKVVKAGKDSIFYKPFEKNNVNISKNSAVTKINCNLLDLSSYIIINREPKNAKIYLNNNQVMNNTIRVQPGDYKIKIKKQTYYSQDTTILVEKGDKRKLSFDLEAKTGTLQFSIEPMSTQVKLKRGDRTIKSWIGSKIVNDLPVGEYRLSMKVDGYRNQFEDINIYQNQTRKLSIQMEEGLSGMPDRYLDSIEDLPKKYSWSYCEGWGKNDGLVLGIAELVPLFGSTIAIGHHFANNGHRLSPILLSSMILKIPVGVYIYKGFYANQWETITPWISSAGIQMLIGFIIDQSEIGHDKKMLKEHNSYYSSKINSIRDKINISLFSTYKGAELRLSYSF